MQNNNHGADRGLGVITWKSYIPLFVIIFIIFLSALVASQSVEDLVIGFMAGFFIVFGAFKLMDLPGFAEGYSTYDLLAGKVKAYGYIYPFMELTFGLLMLSGYHPVWLLWTEFGVMLFSGLGVLVKLMKREPFICACLGTFLKVPLTYISLVENLGMAGLALLSILFSNLI